MENSAVKIGQKVRIKAADYFYEYIDGWSGVVAMPGFRSGYVVVHCERPDGMKEFLVPAAQLVEENE